MLAKKTERNMGIELLRIVSMVMIVILHGLGHGGVREGTQGLGIHEQLAWLLTALCFGAVLLYALITGYLYMSVKHRWYRFGELWLQVLFYSVGVYLLLSFTSGSFSLRELLLCSVLVWLSRICLQWLTLRLFHEEIAVKLFYSYLSPLVVLGAVSLFLFFQQVQIKRGAAFLTELSSLTFGVYLIHEHPTFRALLVQDRFLTVEGTGMAAYWGRVLLFVLVIYCGCSLIEYLRKWLFRLLHVPQLCRYFSEKLKGLLSPRFAKK